MNARLRTCSPFQPQFRFLFTETGGTGEMGDLLRVSRQSIARSDPKRLPSRFSRLLDIFVSYAVASATDPLDLI